VCFALEFLRDVNERIIAKPLIESLQPITSTTLGVSLADSYSRICDLIGRLWSQMSRETAEVQVMALSEIPVGESAVVDSLELPHEVQDHLMHLGFLPEATIDVLRRAPAGDPTVYRVEGAEIALRRETARHIYVRTQIADGDRI
jgi:ferrous iron transport protein A